MFGLSNRIDNWRRLIGSNGGKILGSIFRCRSSCTTKSNVLTMGVWDPSSRSVLVFESKNH